MLENKVVYPYELDATDFVLLFQEARRKKVSVKQILDEAVRMYFQNQRAREQRSEK